MLNKVKEMQDVSFQISLRSSRGGWKAARVSTRKHSWRVAVALPGAPTATRLFFAFFKCRDWLFCIPWRSVAEYRAIDTDFSAIGYCLG